MKAWKQTLSWLAVAGWMVVIFLFSAQTGNDSGDTSGAIVRWVLNLIYRGFDDFPQAQQLEILEIWHTAIRKGAHFTEYAVLAVFIANALRYSSVSEKVRWLLPVAISAAYAVTDEVHQYFVPDRACRLLDVGIDTCGAIFGMCLFAAGFTILKRKRMEK